MERQWERISDPERDEDKMLDAVYSHVLTLSNNEPANLLGMNNDCTPTKRGLPIIRLLTIQLGA